MSFDNHAYHEFKDGLTEAQYNNLKKSDHRWGKKKKKPIKTFGRKQRYYCPVEKAGYLKTPNHTHCPLCHRDYQDDKHEIIPFDPKIHEW